MKSLWAPWRMSFIKSAKDLKGCVFCDLLKENKDTENYILTRSKHCFVILNKFPYSSGHLMVIPYQHTANLAALNDETLLDIHQKIRDSLKALEKMNPQGFNIGMNIGEAGGAGIREHLHYHVVPRWLGDTNFMPVFGEVRILPESLEETHRKLSKAFVNLV